MSARAALIAARIAELVDSGMDPRKVASIVFGEHKNASWEDTFAGVELWLEVALMDIAEKATTPPSGWMGG